MTIKEFLKHTKISSRVFAEACKINHNTFKMYAYHGRIPPLPNAYKIIIQSNYHITMEDLIGRDLEWEPQKKLKTMDKTLVKSATKKMKSHERRKFFTDIDNI